MLISEAEKKPFRDEETVAVLPIVADIISRKIVSLKKYSLKKPPWINPKIINPNYLKNATFPQPLSFFGVRPLPFFCHM